MNGMYCPWCGHVIGSDERLCAHCEEVGNADAR